MYEIVHYSLSCVALVAATSVATNPSPFFGALGLVAVSLTACILLLLSGSGFLSLILFLIYLGGMLVVFAYTSALASDRYPVVWTNSEVLVDFILYLAFLSAVVFTFKGDLRWGYTIRSDFPISFVREDVGGVSLSYVGGKALMVTAGTVLLIALFVALELTRGMLRGALRAV